MLQPKLLSSRFAAGSCTAVDSGAAAAAPAPPRSPGVDKSTGAQQREAPDEPVPGDNDTVVDADGDADVLHTTVVGRDADGDGDVVARHARHHCRRSHKHNYVEVDPGSAAAARFPYPSSSSTHRTTQTPAPARETETPTNTFHTSCCVLFRRPSRPRLLFAGP